MKMSPTLARKSKRPVSRYFPRNFSTCAMLDERGVNFNDEARMTNDEGSPNAQMIESAISACLSSLRLRHSFELRHSSFIIENDFRHSFLSVYLNDLLHGQD